MRRSIGENNVVILEINHFTLSINALLFDNDDGDDRSSVDFLVELDLFSQKCMCHTTKWMIRTVAMMVMTMDNAWSNDSDTNGKILRLQPHHDMYPWI